MISIHALREEGDCRLSLKCREPALFLSTPSARRATKSKFKERTELDISIHALREEGDAKKPANLSRIRNFYPRPPRGGRRPAHSSNTLPVQFLSTPSARRATRQRGPCRHHRSISIHALREEGDVTQAIRGQWPTYFYPRPPRGGRLQHSRPHRPSLKFLSTPSARRATD